jgi:methionine-R-sulfoxide reductase
MVRIALSGQAPIKDGCARPGGRFLTPLPHTSPQPFSKIPVCAGCGAPLFKSDFKFNSGCGWPAFWDELEGSVERHNDDSMGMRRVEITCANCGGHLGHEFRGEGFPYPKPIRHCVNSVSIKFEKKAE